MAPNKMYPIKQQIRNAVLDSMRNTLRTLNTDEALWTRNELVVRKDLAAAAIEEFRDAQKELICVCTIPEDEGRQWQLDGPSIEYSTEAADSLFGA